VGAAGGILSSPKLLKEVPLQSRRCVALLE